MKVATFNVNSIRARLPILTGWLEFHQPDIVGIQETKVEDAKFPMEEITKAGYHAEILGQKSYNGVAILSKEKPDSVTKGMTTWDEDEDCRVIRATFGDLEFINTYVPNGTEVGAEKWDYKMRWMEEFKRYCDSLKPHKGGQIWLGDINVAPEPRDVYDSQKMAGGVGHHEDEFSRLKTIVEGKWTDCYREFADDSAFTFWDFRIPNSVGLDLGWRIDHIYATGDLAKRCTRCWVDRYPRGLERPSDHTPLMAEFDI